MDPTSAAALIGAGAAITGALLASGVALWTTRMTTQNAREQRDFDSEQRELDRQSAMGTELRDKRLNAHLELLAALKTESSLSFASQGERTNARSLTDEVTAVWLMSGRGVSELADKAAQLTWRLWWDSQAMHGEVYAAQLRETEGSSTLTNPVELEAIRKYTRMRAEAHQAILAYRDAAQHEVSGGLRSKLEVGPTGHGELTPKS